MKVQVTQNDINHGISSYTNCPVARALKREQPGVWKVGPENVRWFGDECDCSERPRPHASTVEPLKTWETPRAVGAFIRRFDTYGPTRVAPFEFEL